MWHSIILFELNVSNETFFLSNQYLLNILEYKFSYKKIY